MPSPLILRSFLVVAAFAGFGALGSTAQAGIIVTVGRPCPEISLDRQKPTADSREAMFAESSDTRCVTMPDGQVRCGEIVRVESVSMLPPDWRCTPVSKGVLYCETPSYGASPGAAGAGEFDPEADESYDLADEEIQTLGCSGGSGAAGLLSGLGGLLVLWLVRRRAIAG
jgi:hypothetical protein